MMAAMAAMTLAVAPTPTSKKRGRPRKTDPEEPHLKYNGSYDPRVSYEDAIYVRLHMRLLVGNGTKFCPVINRECYE